MDLFIFVLEIIGTVSFAISGVVIGMRKNLDVFGSSVLGLITAVGGGTLRDLILGNTPPNVFRDPTYALVAIGVSLVFLIPQVRRMLARWGKVYDAALFWMDSLGLGIFTVVGISVSMAVCGGYGMALHVFVGVITGVGGGIMRDVLVGNTPYVFVKHIYAIASIVGAVACVSLWDVLGEMLAMLIGAGVVLTIRCLSAHYKWNLPRIGTIEETK